MPSTLLNRFLSGSYEYVVVLFELAPPVKRYSLSYEYVVLLVICGLLAAAAAAKAW